MQLCGKSGVFWGERWWDTERGVGYASVIEVLRDCDSHGWRRTVGAAFSRDIRRFGTGGDHLAAAGGAGGSAEARFRHGAGVGDGTPGRTARGVEPLPLRACAKGDFTA